MTPKEPRFPCAGCGRKTPVSELHPVRHGTIGVGQWWIDKRCPVCSGKAATPISVAMVRGLFGLLP